MSGSTVKQTINLQTPPSSWDELNDEQLRFIFQLQQKGVGIIEYKLKIFLHLMGLKILNRAEKKEDGSFTYHFRRKGILPCIRREVLNMEAWEVDYWIKTYLSFLDEPGHLMSLPFDYWKRWRKRFKAPGTLMLDVTYEQYSNAQNYLTAYTQQLQLAESMLNNGSHPKAVKRIQQQALDSRAGFLSHLFIAPQWQLTDSDTRSTRLNVHRAYRYSNQLAERHKCYFKAAPDYLFWVAVRFFQGCLEHFKKELPDLFKEGDKVDDRTVWMMEVDTINAVQKYQGYNKQQEVYDSEAVFVFGILNNMIQEAKEVEKMNSKIRKK